jgi:hypothetical protein
MVLERSVKIYVTMGTKVAIANMICIATRISLSIAEKTKKESATRATNPCVKSQRTSNTTSTIKEIDGNVRKNFCISFMIYFLKIFTIFLFKAYIVK